jgi:hypothetical protein
MTAASSAFTTPVVVLVTVAQDNASLILNSAGNDTGNDTDPGFGDLQLSQDALNVMGGICVGGLCVVGVAWATMKHRRQARSKLGQVKNTPHLFFPTKNSSG